MTRSWRLSFFVGPLFALVLGQMPACSSPAGPTAGACTEETVFSGHTPLPASTFVIQPLTTTKTGRLQVTVDWVSPANIVSTVLAQAPCSVDQFKADHCNVILNLFPPPKPLDASTFWVGPGTYDLILGNFSPVADTASTRVILTSTGCAAPGKE